MRGPRLELDWEEGLFRGLLALWDRFASGSRPEPSLHAVTLEEMRPRLQVLAQILAGEPIRILESRELGGVRGAELLLPSQIELADSRAENRRLYLVRTAVSAGMRRLTRGRRAPEGLEGELASLEMGAKAVEWLSSLLPRFGEVHAAAVELYLSAPLADDQRTSHARAWEQAKRAALRGERPWDDRELVGTLRARVRRKGLRPPILIWGAWLPALDSSDPGLEGLHRRANEEIATELAAPRTESLRRVQLDPKEQEDAVLIHTFEKAEALDSYRGGARDLDGADELEAHSKALEEVDLGALIRTSEPTRSLLKGDFNLGLSIPEAADLEGGPAGIPYDEWDQRTRRYRVGWCTVYSAKFEGADVEWRRAVREKHRRLIRDLRRRLERHRSGLRARNRQLDGEDFDLMSVVDAHVSRCAGKSPDPRVYVRRQRHRRDFATTVLVDVSLSSDSWVSNRRVLDVSREAIFVLGEVVDQLGDQLQVLAFASHTRNRCCVWELKGWNDAWSIAAARLGALEPTGYTRIGPALRHATAQLARAAADRRLLLLVSDGKPIDYDRYEGRYGIADIRRAVQEARNRAIVTHALAIDATAKDTLPAQFGPGGWHILSKPDELIAALTTVYGRLTPARA